MKKVILTLIVSLSCIMMAHARWNPSVVDTLPKRVVNGLEVTPIRTTYKSGVIHWRLRVSDFEKCFRKFESRYPGGINYNLESKEAVEAIFVWEDHIWEKVLPADVRVLEGIVVRLYINKEGRIFTAEFSMLNKVFEKLDALPRNTLKNLYNDLIKERCEAIKNVEFHSLNWDSEFDRAVLWSVCGSAGIGNEYVMIGLSWDIYDIFGTFNKLKILRMSDDERGELFEKHRLKVLERKRLK